MMTTMMTAIIRSCKQLLASCFKQTNFELMPDESKAWADSKVQGTIGVTGAIYGPSISGGREGDCVKTSFILDGSKNNTNEIAISNQTPITVTSKPSKMKLV